VEKNAENIQFVRVPGLGLGRLAETLSGGMANVEFLKSPSAPTNTQLVNNASPAKLQRGERVWITPEIGETKWLTGRIAADVHETKRTFFVTLPNVKDPVEVNECRIWPRWDVPLDDPVGMLINHVGESPFLYNNRINALTHVAAQRSRIAGLTGLWTSVVEIHEHQVETARRILMDPIQRYLLSDEVGLGKTIEAGLVIRQILSQESDSRILVLTPDHLIQQWESELSSKFFHSDYGKNRVLVSSHSALGSIAGDFSMCVIDEAHHLVVHPHHGDDKEKIIYSQLQDLCRRTERILLLTATPVRAGDLDYLAILHLLSEDTHPLNAIDEFREKLDIRNSIAEIMIGFTPAMEAAFIPLVLEDLRELIPNDILLHELLDKVEEAVTANQPYAQQIEIVRSRISNKYRLHSRLIRHRRVGKLLSQFPVRGRQLETYIHTSSGDDNSREILFELQDAVSGIVTDDKTKSNIMRICLYFLSTGTWAATRDIDEVSSSLGKEFVTRLIEAARMDDTCNRRIADVVTFIRDLRTPKKGSDLRKKVIFTSSPDLANALQEKMASAFGSVNVFRMTPTNPEKVVANFRSAPGQAFLICDSSVEEGFNLQFAEVVVFADLPFNTRSLEQRIGRFDRFSIQYSPIQLIVVSDPGVIGSTWTKHVVNTGILSGSISGLQYALSDYEQNFLVRWASAGNDEAQRIAENTAAFVQHELRELEKQDVIDGNELPVRDSNSYTSNLVSETRAEKSFEVAITRYAGDLGLHFERLENGVLKLSSNHSKRHLISPQRAGMFRPEQWDQKGSFQRETAIDSTERTRFYGLGYPLIDAIADALATEDKGRISARRLTVSSLPPDSIFLFFSFNYLVMADISRLKEQDGITQQNFDQSVALLQQSFPTIIRTCVLDDQFKTPASQYMQLILSPYKKSKDDINLCGSGYEEFIALTSRYPWSDMCRQAESIAKDSVIDESLRNDLISLKDALNSRLLESRSTIISRVESGMDTSTAIDEHDLFSAAIMDVQSAPLVTIDSVQVTFLTGPQS
jgi:ATP-dependent helicase HepA